jgi:hypothetical protein
MTKLTKRKGFNFLRSYFDVLNELKNDSDKLNFLMAIINKQFLDENPKDLEFLVNLCYESQRHQIEKSVKGWKQASNTDLLGNPLSDPKGNPPSNPPSNPLRPKGEVQEQVQVQVQEKVKYIPDFSEFLDHAISKEPNVDEYALKLKFESWVENGWKDGNNRKITNWKSKLTNTIQFIAKGTNSRIKRKVKVF